MLRRRTSFPNSTKVKLELNITRVRLKQTGLPRHATSMGTRTCITYEVNSMHVGECTDETSVLRRFAAISNLSEMHTAESFSAISSPQTRCMRKNIFFPTGTGDFTCVYNVCHVAYKYTRNESCIHGWTRITQRV